MNLDQFKSIVEEDQKLSDFFLSISKLGKRYQMMKNFLSSDFKDDEYQINDIKLDDMRIIVSFSEPILMSIVNEKVRDLIKKFLEEEVS